MNKIHEQLEQIENKIDKHEEALSIKIHEQQEQTMLKDLQLELVLVTSLV